MGNHETHIMPDGEVSDIINPSLIGGRGEDMMKGLFQLCLLALALGMVFGDVEGVFNTLDKNDDGFLDEKEMYAIPDHHLPTGYENAAQIQFADIDKDGDGKINKVELYNFLMY